MRKIKRRPIYYRKLVNGRWAKVKFVQKRWKYTYEYDNPEFLKYVLNKTGIRFGEEVRPNLSRFFLVDPKSDKWILTSKNFKYLNGKTIPIDNRYLHLHVQITMREVLQREWNNYTKSKNPNQRKIKRRKKSLKTSEYAPSIF